MSSGQLQSTLYGGRSEHHEAAAAAAFAHHREGAAKLQYTPNYGKLSLDDAEVAVVLKAIPFLPPPGVKIQGVHAP